MKKLIILLLIGTCSLLGCGTSYENKTDNSETVVDEKANVENYKYGVVLSSEGEEDSYLECLDENLKSVGKYHLNISNIVGWSYGEPIKYNEELYFLSNGYGMNKDDCRINSINFKTGDMQEIKCKDRVAIADFVIDDNYAYTVCNLNGISYVDRYNRVNKKRDTVELKKAYDVQIELCNGILYVVNVDENSNSYVCKIDFEHNKAENVAKFDLKDKNMSTADVCLQYKNKLFFPDNGILHIYDCDKNEIRKIKLPCEGLFLAQKKDNKMYILSSQFFDYSIPSELMEIDMDKEEFVKKYQFDKYIQDFRMQDEKVFTIDSDNKISICKLNNDETVKCIKSEYVSEEGEYCYKAIFNNTSVR